MPETRDIQDVVDGIGQVFAHIDDKQDLFAALNMLENELQDQFLKVFERLSS